MSWGCHILVVCCLSWWFDTGFTADVSAPSSSSAAHNCIRSRRHSLASSDCSHTANLPANTDLVWGLMALRSVNKGKAANWPFAPVARSKAVAVDGIIVDGLWRFLSSFRCPSKVEWWTAKSKEEGTSAERPQKCSSLKISFSFAILCSVFGAPLHYKLAGQTLTPSFQNIKPWHHVPVWSYRACCFIEISCSRCNSQASESARCRQTSVEAPLHLPLSQDWRFW